MRDRLFSAPARGSVAQSRTGAALAATVLLCLTTLMGCDSQKISELEEGVSTEADVRKRFGEPVAVYNELNGDVTLEYPRQPAGHVNYMISIGPDGKQIWPTRPRTIDVGSGDYNTPETATEAAHAKGIEWVENYG